MELLQVHQVVDPGEQQPLATPEPPDLRVIQRARIRSRGRRRTERPVRRSAGSGRSCGAGSRGPRRRPPGSPGRPSARRAASGRTPPATPPGTGRPATRTCDRGLGDVPVALAAGGAQRGFGECLGHRRERVGHGGQLSHESGRTPGPRTASHLAADGQGLALLDPAPGGDDVRRAGFERVHPRLAHRRWT